MPGMIMKIGNNWSRKILPLLAWTAFAVACNDGGGGSNSPQQYGTIRFGMVGDATGARDFVATTDFVATADFDLTLLTLAEMELPWSERTLFPIGPIDRGDGGHNFHQWEQPFF